MELAEIQERIVAEIAATDVARLRKWADAHEPTKVLGVSASNFDCPLVTFFSERIKEFAPLPFEVNVGRETIAVIPYGVKVPITHYRVLDYFVRFVDGITDSTGGFSASIYPRTMRSVLDWVEERLGGSHAQL